MLRLALSWFFAVGMSSLLFVVVLPCAGGDEPPSPSSVVGAKPDPWVSAAPMIVAAVCRDGIAMLALHTESSQQTDNDNNNDNKDDNTSRETNWMDTYRGPARIAQIDADGTALLCAGWRPDADWLATKCRSMAAMEARTFHTLAPQDVSLWMAQCASSSSHVRALSVVGLLCRARTVAATTSTTQTDDDNEDQKEIWLVDVTGAYSMRAVAVGRGAKVVNNRLCKIDFSNMTARDGVDRLCHLLLLEEGDEEGWEPVANTTHVELALIHAKQKQLHRIRQPFLVATKTSAV